MEQTTQTKVRRKRRVNGRVASIAGVQTIVVVASHRVMHQTYRKYVIRKVRYMAHDESSICQAGDLVQIEESRPLSARKRWRVVRKLEKSEAA